MSKKSILLLLLIAIISLNTASANIQIPDGAIDTSDCPCDIELGPNADAQIRACDDCATRKVLEWVESQEGQADSLLPTEHRLAEEIERLNKLRKKELLEKQAKIIAKEKVLDSYLRLLMSEGLSKENFKNLIKLIDNLVYEQRDDLYSVSRLKGLRSKLIIDFKKSVIAYDKKVEEVEREEAEKEAQKKAEEEAKIAEEKFMKEATDKAIKGDIDDRFYGVFWALENKDSLESHDIDAIHRVLKDIETLIGASYVADGDEKGLEKLLDLKEEYGKLLTGGKITDDLAIQKSIKEGIDFEIERYTKSLKEPPVVDPAIAKSIERSKNKLQLNLAAWDKIDILEEQMKNEVGESKLNTANAIAELRKDVIRSDRLLKNRYEEILKKDETNVDANFGLAQLLSNQGNFDEAKIVRMRAFFHATPTQRNNMNAELEAKFLSQLQMAKKPELENSLYLKRLRADFGDEYVSKNINPSHDLFDPTYQSEVFSKATEWAWKKSAPIRLQLEKAKPRRTVRTPTAVPAVRG